MRKNINRMEQFEKIVEDILRTRDYKIISTPSARDAGVDWIVSKNGEKMLVEAKFLLNPVSASISSSVSRGASTLALAARFHGEETRLLLVTSFNVPKFLLDRYYRESLIQIWDLKWLSEFVISNSSLKKKYSESIADLNERTSATTARVEGTPRYVSLKQKLEGVPSGRTAWRDYEDVCIEILNYVFSPPFVLPPVIQDYTSDNLHRRDAIYQLDVEDSIWDRIQNQFRTRFVVAEFKNHTNNLGQDEVDDICRYLLPTYLRSLGFLCGRKGPDDNAIVRRAAIWTHEQKLVVFLSDEDMISLLELKASDNNPAQYVDDKINTFLMRTN